MAIAIKVENLSKAYQIGEIGTGTISRDLERWFAKIKGKEDPFLKIGEINNHAISSNTNIVWSLSDINFEIEEGDAVGIIGRNGAGKSTLLKLLSRITSPTTGIIKAKGRIASLLEVGTGFHPELTGKENIYLNGAILGMRKKSIDRKFDEIVNFSGVEKYINTPVKRYSTGMYVRLAFAVAAYLESEILIVDEVLAVGDAEFQSKCISKMGEVTKQDGRTILFVSHNMAAIKNLCNKTIVLDHGRIEANTNASEGISHYFNLLNNKSESLVIKELIKAEEDEILKYLSIKVVQNGVEVQSIHNDLDTRIEIHYKIKQKALGFRLFIYFIDKYENLISQSFFDENNDAGTTLEEGEYFTVFTIPADIFIDGVLTIKIFAGLHAIRMCKPYSGIQLQLDIIETGLLRRKRFSDEYRGAVTLPLKVSTKYLSDRSI